MTLGGATQAVSLMQSKTGGGSEAGVSPERKTHAKPGVSPWAWGFITTWEVEWGRVTLP